MEKILDFLKTLFIPRLMKRYRYMSVLISVIIFMASVYLLNLPVSYQISKGATELRESYNYQVLLDLENSFEANPDNEVALQDIGALECSVDRGFLNCPKIKKISETEDSVEYEVFERDLEYVNDGITKKIKFIVDLNVINPEFNDVIDDLEDVPYEENTEYYKVMLTSDGILFQAHQYGINDEEIEHNGTKLIFENRYYTYVGFMPEFNLNLDKSSSRNIGNRLVDYLINSDIRQYTSSAFIYLLLTIFILPLIFVLILWLFFRRTGKLTRYKEYYNIAAICTIAPVLITFLVTWVWMQAFNYYMYVFALFYLFALYKINSMPDDVN